MWISQTKPGKININLFTLIIKEYGVIQNYSGNLKMLNHFDDNHRLFPFAVELHANVDPENIFSPKFLLFADEQALQMFLQCLT